MSEQQTAVEDDTTSSLKVRIYLSIMCIKRRWGLHNSGLQLVQLNDKEKIEEISRLRYEVLIQRQDRNNSSTNNILIEIHFSWLLSFIMYLPVLHYPDKISASRSIGLFNILSWKIKRMTSHYHSVSQLSALVAVFIHKVVNADSYVYVSIITVFQIWHSFIKHYSFPLWNPISKQQIMNHTAENRCQSIQH